MPGLKWQDDGAPFSKWTGLCKFRFYLEFTALQWIPLLLLKHVSTSTSLCACLWYEHHYSFCVFGVKWKSNEISLALTTLTIPVVYIRGCMLGCGLIQWPPNQILSVHWDTTGQTTLEHHWRHKYTGMPLEPHWLVLAPMQWCPSGDPVLICIIGTHWKTTGATSTVGCHWKPTGWC